HGGQVRADSTGVGRGATFTVDLPASVAPPAGMARPEPHSLLDGALTRIKVWIADDDLDAHEVVSLTLGQAGAIVACHGSGAELAAALERALPANGPDVLLIDLAMPGEDGFEALRRVRSLELA